MLCVRGEASPRGGRAARARLVPRTAQLCKLHCPATGDALDLALVLPFSAPHSATGEDVVELHVHGGGAVVRSVRYPPPNPHPLSYLPPSTLFVALPP